MRFQESNQKNILVGNGPNSEIGFTLAGYCANTVDFHSLCQRRRMLPAWKKSTKLETKTGFYVVAMTSTVKLQTHLSRISILPEMSDPLYKLFHPCK